MIIIDENQCKSLAKHLAKTANLSQLPKEPCPNVSKEKIERVFFYPIGICHGTKGAYEGVVNGKPKKGFDYLVACFIRELNKNPAFLSETNMKAL